VNVKISPQAPNNRQMLLCMRQQTPEFSPEQSQRPPKPLSGSARKV
jgi:hypothetical protein